MRKLFYLAAAILVTTAASPSPYDSLTGGPRFLEATISPDIQPSARPVVAAVPGYTPAPVPDLERMPPTVRTLGPAQPQLSPGLFQPRTTFRGDGYTQGSTVQGNQERKLRLTPGFNLKMPLE